MRDVIMLPQFEKFKDVPEEIRKKYNMVDSPDWVCDWMVSHFPIDHNSSYLDPCVGRGACIKALIKAGVKEEQITACDIYEGNIEYCRSIWKKVNYRVCDLMTIVDKFDFVIGVPPWIKKLPGMLIHINSLAIRKCILIAPFWLDKKNYARVDPFVSGFLMKDFDFLVKSAFADSHYFSAPCIYEFSNTAVGLITVLKDWIDKNGLNEYFTFNVKESVPNNLVLYNGQEYFLHINPVWFYGFIKGGFNIKSASKIGILGKFKEGRKCYGLVYNSKAELERAYIHYTSAKLKKMLICGLNFGWNHLRAI